MVTNHHRQSGGRTDAGDNRGNKRTSLYGLSFSLYHQRYGLLSEAKRMELKTKTRNERVRGDSRSKSMTTTRRTDISVFHDEEVVDCTLVSAREGL